MKWLLCILIIASCKQPATIKQPANICKTDTIYSIQYIHDTIHDYQFNQQLIDSLSSKLFVANFKIERVKYYLNICLKNPSQDRFLKGWVRRAVE